MSDQLEVDMCSGKNPLVSMGLMSFGSERSIRSLVQFNWITRNESKYWKIKIVRNYFFNFIFANVLTFKKSVGF
jgi:hypothetical protein